jgi:AcrR family transcriptional regulator
MSADDRRAELLAAALRVMSRDGVAAGTTRAIAAEAGMVLATFHYCFRSRNELLRELILMLTEIEREAARAAMQPGRNIRETLRSAVDGYLEHLEKNPGHEQVLMELNHHALRTPELRDLADEQYRQYYESATMLLTTAAELANVTWTVDLPVLARMVVTLIDGATTTWLVDHDTEQTRAVLHPLIDYAATLTKPVRGARKRGA